MRDALGGHLGELRHEPTDKRVRGMLGGRVIVDSSRAVLVWEPRRVVPSYAVPDADVRGELVPAARPATAAGPDARILHPGIPFAAHSTPGEPLTLRAGERVREGAAFRPADPDLAELVVLDFTALDAWYEEDDELVGHPRDPYHRVDIRPSSRHVRIELDGRTLADSGSPTLVFETSLPTRFYLPATDVHADLVPSDRRTYCAYKGEATYWSVAGHADLAWTYRDPLPDAGRLAGLIAFFDDLVDVVVDGERRERPGSALARAVLDESGVAPDA